MARANMKYIIGLCGTHGTGKSTILQGVKALGPIADETQLSRAAQKELGWDTLAKAQESEENMWKLQEAILGAMYDRDLKISKSELVTIVERTPADVWAYTSMWCERVGIDIKTDKHALNYKQRCRDMATRYATFLYVPVSEHIPFVIDPHRADLESREYVAKAIDTFLWDGNLPIHIIKSIPKEYRVAEAYTVILTNTFKTNK